MLLSSCEIVCYILCGGRHSTVECVGQINHRTASTCGQVCRRLFTGDWNPSFQPRAGRFIVNSHQVLFLIPTILNFICDAHMYASVLVREDEREGDSYTQCVIRRH